MAKKNYIVTRAGSYGDRGAVVELDTGKDGLSDRQKIMLKPYSKPVVKVDDSKELTKANDALEAANKVNDDVAGELKIANDKIDALEAANKVNDAKESSAIQELADKVTALEKANKELTEANSALTATKAK